MFKPNLFVSRIFMVLTLPVVIVFASCTDMTEPIDDQVTTENFFQKPEDFVSAMGDSYTALNFVGGVGGYPVLQEVPSDEMIVPQLGEDWFDGGVYIRMKRHNWTYSLPRVNSAWQDLFSGVNNCNRLIFQFEQAIESGNADPEQADRFIKELRALRAFYYYWLLDSFGNVPIVTSFEDAPENPSQPSENFQEGRQAVFDFVEQELTESLDVLSTDVNGTYGRINKYVAHMTLAKLYLNAKVYTGTERWSDALTHLDAIIDSGKYSLAANYSDNFLTENAGSPELIFAYPYDRVFAPGFFMIQGSLPNAMQTTFNLQNQPWNGFSAQQKVYESYIDSTQNPGPQGEVWGIYPTETKQGLERIQGTLDDRRDNLIVGPQFSASGERLTDASAKSEFDPNGKWLTVTPFINMLEPNAARQSGARIGKYEIEMGAAPSLSNDYVIYRYSDVLLMKAEALWRQDPQSTEALRLVNLVRNRAGVHDFKTLNKEKILSERLRELWYELVRRRDLIRFEGDEGETEFNDSWRFKKISDAHRNVFPIPREQLETNVNLVQNPGYQGR